MTRISSLSLALFVLLSIPCSGQLGPERPESIVLDLPYGVDAGTVSIAWIGSTEDRSPLPPLFRTGRLAGETGVWTYPIEASVEGEPFVSLQVLVHSPNYLAWKADLSPFLEADQRAVDIPVPLQPRSHVTLTGRVVDYANRYSDKQLSVRYSPRWECQFLHIIDCMLPAWPIATAVPDLDGRFSVTVPDFASDPVLARYPHLGGFTFFLADKARLTMLGWDGCPEVAFAASYPDVIVLTEWAIEDPAQDESSTRQIPATCF